MTSGSSYFFRLAFRRVPFLRVAFFAEPFFRVAFLRPPFFRAAMLFSPPIDVCFTCPETASVRDCVSKVSNTIGQHRSRLLSAFAPPT